MSKNADKIVGRAATVGMFDGVHIGHHLVISQLCSVAAETNLIPTVFTFDRHPMSLIAPARAPKALTTNAQKADLLVGYGAEDVIYLAFDDFMRNMSASAFLSMIHSTYGVKSLVVGFNHHFGHDRKGTFADYQLIGAEIGIELIRADEFVDSAFGKPISSSTIRNLIADGDITTANKMLGHPFAISGYVVHGRNIGTKIGFPTANVRPFLDTQIIPKEGVYAALVNVAGSCSHYAMVNVGTNPTIQATSHPLTIEAHIMDFKGEIYNQPIEVRFIARLRDEMAFPSLEALTAQLTLDRHSALAALTFGS